MEDRWSLVNWDSKSGKFIGGDAAPDWSIQKVKDEASNMPSEYKELISAMDGYWRAIRLSSLCGFCFSKASPVQVEPGRMDTRGRGCCSTCKNLSNTGCIAKPLGCAFYSCYSAQSILRIQPEKLIHQVRTILYNSDRRTSNEWVSQVYAAGWESTVRHKFTKEQLAALREASSLVRLVTQEALKNGH